MDKQEIIQKLTDYLEKDNENVKSLFGQIVFFIFQTEGKNDMYKLFQFLGFDNTIKMVDYFAGKTIKLPTRQEFLDTMKWAIIFYMREYLGASWKEISKQLDTEGYDGTIDCEVSVERKVRTIKRRMNKHIYKMLHEVGEEGLFDIYSSLIDDKKE